MAADRPEGPDGVEKLSSNVMNYLVWRYLQESGYGKTAKQLQYQWMGREQSPEHLPFAQNIKKSCLVHLAQDGLLLDHLQAEVKHTNRQYLFGSDHGRKFSIPAEDLREKKTRVRSTSRMPSTSEGGMQNGSPAEPPAQRRGKGKRKSGGTEKRMNGDAMDVDHTVGTTSTNDSVAAEAESPLPAIEEVVPLSTLEIGESKGTLTEQPRDLVPTTAFVELEDGLLLEQVKWSPHNKTALATGGHNHLHIYKIPSSSELPEKGLYSKSTKVKIDSEEFDVQAFSWTEKGSGAFTTLEKFQNEVGDELSVYKMIGFNDFGQTTRLVDATAGWVLALKYNPESQLLLSLSWGEQSHVKIWDYSETIIENSKRRVEPSYELKFSKTMDSMLFEAVWTAPNRFMVCGRGTLDVYEVGDDIQPVKSVPTEHDWAQLKFDDVYEVAAVLDETMQTVGIVNLEGDLKILTETLPDKVTDLAFQPLDAKPSEEELAGKPPQRILAIALDMGKIHIWNVLGELQCLQKLDMGWDAVAQSIAFSPDGFLLAAAGYDTLRVWKTMGGSEPKAVWVVPSGTDERWKSEAVSEEDEENDGFVHKLGWDADGKRIAFGMNGQVAIIRMI